MGSNDFWVRLRTERPIGKPGTDNVFLIEDPDGHRAQTDPTPLKGWQGFNVIIFGARARIIRPHPAVPYWRLETPGGGERYIQIRCARLWDTGSSVAAEAVWLPSQGGLTYIRVTTDAWSDGQLRRAGAGIKLLRGLPLGAGGAPTLSRDTMVKEFAEALLAIAQEEKIPFHRVTWKAIGEKMGIGEEGVRYRKKLAKEARPEITKPEVVAAASSLRLSWGDKESQI